jgi:Polyketide cyclase / dehydrase and lipid transport
MTTTTTRAEDAPLMAHVSFNVTRSMPLAAADIFAALVDWRGHAGWVPLTKVQVLSGDGGAGTEFIATTGIGPLALPDRMRVDSLDTAAMSVRITKLGPHLTGNVTLKVTPTSATTSRLEWSEHLDASKLPKFLATPVGHLAALSF